MKIVQQACRDLNLSAAVDKKEAFVGFRTEKDVRQFSNPVFSNRVFQCPYVVVRKRAFTMDIKNIALQLENNNSVSIVFCDTADKSFQNSAILERNMPFLDLSRQYVYLKLNLRSIDMKNMLNINLLPFCQSPTQKFLLIARNYPELCDMPYRDRNLFCSFTGQLHKEPRLHRKAQFEKLREICADMNIPSQFGGKGGRKQYFDTLCDSKVGFSWKGVGYRCRREWEILLSGACLILDYIIEQDHFLIPDLEPNIHFMYQENRDDFLQELLTDKNKLRQIASNGRQFAQQVLFDHDLSLEERWLRAYLLNQKAKILSYSDLCIEEQKMALT